MIGNSLELLPLVEQAEWLTGRTFSRSVTLSGRGVAMDSATSAAWANVAVTGLTFAIALVLFIIGLRDRRRADDDRLRTQARKVWIWAAAPFEERQNYNSSGERVKSAGWKINNTSADPITACRVGLASATPQSIADLEPDVAVLEGEKQAVDKVRGGIIPMDAELPPVQLIFKDAAGMQWRRDSSGNLDLWERPRRRRS